MNTLLQGPSYGMRMLRLSEQLVLGPTDRPISKRRRLRNKWRRLRSVIIFWSLISGVLLYGLVIEPMRLVVRKTAITLPAWPVEFRDMRVTVFSDLHVGPPHITLARLRGIDDCGPYARGANLAAFYRATCDFRLALRHWPHHRR